MTGGSTSNPRADVREGFLSGQPKLRTDEAVSLTSDLFEAKAYNVLISFQDNESSGAFGLNKEFYIIFLEQLKMPLLDIYRHSLRMGSICMDQKRGIISLILQQS